MRREKGQNDLVALAMLLKKRQEKIMRSPFVAAIAAALVFWWIVPPAQADDVTGRDRMLCAIVEVNFCSPGGLCDQGPPWFWNVPDFIEIDLIAKELRTTKASSQNRKTPIRSIIRENGDVVLGGLERGRSFVMSIREETGELTVTVAAWEKGGVGFGTCTPLQP